MGLIWFDMILHVVLYALSLWFITYKGCCEHKKTSHPKKNRFLLLTTPGETPCFFFCGVNAVHCSGQ